jgi:glucose/mannose-6-phosphate isomerase
VRKPGILDNPRAIAAADPSGMATRLLDLPRQARIGWELGGRVVTPRPGSPWRPQNVVIAGMGGSGIGAALIKGIADRTPGAVPVNVWRDYHMPAWVGPSTLVIAISVSGSTAETVSAFRAALRQGARCLAVSGPRELARAADAAGIQVLRVDHSGEPRTALGHTFVAPLRALQRLGAMPDSSDEFTAAVPELEGLIATLRPDVAVERNRAKQIAINLQGRVPVVYGGGHLAPVAGRWKTQFNENADTWAVVDEMPEANHNAVQGYALPEAMRELVTVLLLESSNLPGEIRDRLRLTAGLMTEERVDHRVLEVGGAGILDDVLRGCLLGDLASYYLAVLLGRDPSATPALTRLRDRNQRAAGNHGQSWTRVVRA